MTNKPLRFAVLIRVSTERQAKKGESLLTQQKQTNEAVKHLGGTITHTYAGQEHATEGWEREQLDKLLADAQKKPRPFDAVIVADPSRWSRDNVASDTGLTLLRDAGVRFFVLGKEFDLHNEADRMFLRLSATIGAYHAETQKRKSIENKIERAKRGIPASGSLPFGRTYDQETGKWAVVPEKQALVEEAARRYLGGEGMADIAKSLGVSQTGLNDTLRNSCGPTWEVRFRSKNLNIDETIIVPVPELLPAETIKAVKYRLLARRTFQHGAPKHDYLLSGFIFCAHCGYRMSAQSNHNDRTRDGELQLYYRHATRREADRCPSPKPRPWLKADEIEGQVIAKLFGMFGNPTQIDRAVRAAVPNCDSSLRQRDRLNGELAKVSRARTSLLNLIEKDAITYEHAEKKLLELKEREDGLREELDRVDSALAEMPDEERIRAYVEQAGNAIFVYRADRDEALPGGNDLNTYLDMTRDDKRGLLRAVFGSPLGDGSPAGVYVNNDRTFTIKGRLEFEAVLESTSRRSADRPVNTQRSALRRRPEKAPAFVLPPDAPAA